MAIIDSLLYRNPDPDLEGFLPPDEVQRRVVARFPLAVVDRERANQIVRAAADEMVALGLPSTDTIVANHLALEGRVAYVTVRELDVGPRLGFFLFPCPSMLEIEYERPTDRDANRPLLEALAAELAEYDIVSEDLDD